MAHGIITTPISCSIELEKLLPGKYIYIFAIRMKTISLFFIFTNRYRKINLYLEGNLESPVPSDFVTFDTDFGVKFGVIICFDMLFKEPALNLTRIEGVSNIVYSTAWLSSVPFLIGTFTFPSYFIFIKFGQSFFVCNHSF